MDDAGSGDRDSRARRPAGRLLVVLAVLLLLGGGTAMAVGLLGQDADPPAPSVARASAPPAATATGTTPAPGSAGPASPSTPASPSAAAPVSMSVPAIGVRSDLVTVGLNPDGTLEVTQPGPDYDKAAWFRGSPRPGDPGPAVIEGHVDSAANGPSVFYELGALRPGDRVEVTREDGTAVGFEVYEVRTVPKDDFPTLEVYGNTEGPELRLITCGGPFDSSARSYVDNVIVFARAVV